LKTLDLRNNKIEVIEADVALLARSEHILKPCVEQRQNNDLSNLEFFGLSDNVQRKALRYFISSPTYKIKFK